MTELTHAGWPQLLHGEGLTKSVMNEAGDFIFIPPDVPHQPVNLSHTEPAIAMVARDDPDEQEHVILLPKEELPSSELNLSLARWVPDFCAYTARYLCSFNSGIGNSCHTSGERRRAFTDRSSATSKPWATRSRARSAAAISAFFIVGGNCSVGKKKPEMAGLQDCPTCAPPRKAYQAARLNRYQA
jgi:hypothetical protein